MVGRWGSISATVLILASSPVFGQPGSTTFVGTAPPPTAEERARAEEYRTQVTSYKERLDQLAKAQHALKVLDRTLGDAKGGATGQTSAFADALVALTKEIAALTSESGSAIAKAAVTLNAAITGAEVDATTATELQEVIAKARTVLFQRFDETLVQHGNKNLWLRFYPNNILVADADQPFVDCDLINVYSRDFRCLSRKAIGIVDNPGGLFEQRTDLAQFCTTDEVEPFGRKDYPAKRIFVRRGSAVSPEIVKARC